MSNGKPCFSSSNISSFTNVAESERSKVKIVPIEYPFQIPVDWL
jgi:hypothetical protein